MTHFSSIFCKDCTFQLWQLKYPRENENCLSQCVFELFKIMSKAGVLTAGDTDAMVDALLSEGTNTSSSIPM